MTTEKILHLTTKHSSTSYTVSLTIPFTGIKETHIVTKEGSLWYVDNTMATNSLTNLIRILKEEMALKYDL